MKKVVQDKKPVKKSVKKVQRKKPITKKNLKTIPRNKVGAPIGNQNAVGNNGGRPALFESPEALQLKIDEYFNGGAHKKQYPGLTNIIEIPVFTICGLAYFLGFSSRASLYEYEKIIEFSDTIKRARLRIEMNYEESLQEKSPTGSIFALKNMGWVDRQELTGKDGDPLSPPVVVFKDFNNADS